MRPSTTFNGAARTVTGVTALQSLATVMVTIAGLDSHYNTVTSIAALLSASGARTVSLAATARCSCTIQHPMLHQAQAKQLAWMVMHCLQVNFLTQQMEGVAWQSRGATQICTDNLLVRA